jgi:hypothetical protein
LCKAEGKIGRSQERKGEGGDSLASDPKAVEAAAVRPRESFTHADGEVSNPACQKERRSHHAIKAPVAPIITTQRQPSMPNGVSGTR